MLKRVIKKRFLDRFPNLMNNRIVDFEKSLIYVDNFDLCEYRKYKNNNINKLILRFDDTKTVKTALVFHKFTFNTVMTVSSPILFVYTFPLTVVVNVFMSPFHIISAIVGKKKNLSIFIQLH